MKDAIDVRRAHVRAAAAGQISVTEIVGENQEDVWANEILGPKYYCRIREMNEPRAKQ